MKLNDIRRKIDRIDSEIIGLLSERSRLVSEAGKLKEDEAGVRDQGRVEQVISKIKEKAEKSGLDPDIAEQIYRTAINCFINKELKESGYESMKDEIRVYNKDQLSLKPNVQGATMWAVALDKAMLTYFELEPETVFPEHSHKAEQITMILEGELTFVYDNREVTLREGDVIAIPSDLIHSAYTGNMPCKAVDAWSPVRKEFL